MIVDINLMYQDGTGCNPTHVDTGPYTALYQPVFTVKHADTVQRFAKSKFESYAHAHGMNFDLDLKEAASCTESER